MKTHLVVIRDLNKEEPIELGPFNKSQARAIKNSMCIELRESDGYCVSIKRIENYNE